MTWWMYALLSAVAAAATAILAKAGLAGVAPALATAIRTTVVLVFSWGLVFATGQHAALGDLRSRPILFLLLSGAATGVSWLSYFKALQLAPVSRVAPIDKLSLVFTVILAILVLGESVSWRVALGIVLMIVGALVAAAP